MVGPVPQYNYATGIIAHELKYKTHVLKLIY